MNLRGQKKYYASPKPGVDPNGSGDHATVFVALYGTSESPKDLEHDVYSRFMQRSVSMGWMRENEDLWILNDAESVATRSADRLIAWYHVDVEDQTTSSAPLPIQPLIRCAFESTIRDRNVGLEGVQLLVPVSTISDANPERSPLPSMSSARWFIPQKSNSASTIEVRVDFSRDESAKDVEVRFFELMRKVNPPNVVVLDIPPITRPPLKLPFGEHFWNGPGDSPLEFTVIIPFGDIDELGWFAAFISDVLARVGISKPVLQTLNIRKCAP